jgi:hypothetical protein
MNRQINSFVGLFLGVLLFSSCENVLEMPENQNFNSELGEYLESAEFVSFQSSFPDFSSKLNFELLKKVELNENEALYLVPTQLENSKIGILNIIKNKEGKFKPFFELRTFKNEMQSATLEYFTIDGFSILKINAKKESLGKFYSIEFPEISNNARMSSCTGDCYKTAVEICDGDGDCKLLCDLLDLGGLCTVSIAVACIIHCW